MGFCAIYPLTSRIEFGGQLGLSTLI